MRNRLASLIVVKQEPATSMSAVVEAGQNGTTLPNFNSYSSSGYNGGYSNNNNNNSYHNNNNQHHHHHHHHHHHNSYSSATATLQTSVLAIKTELCTTTAFSNSLSPPLPSCTLPVEINNNSSFSQNLNAPPITDDLRSCFSNASAKKSATLIYPCRNLFPDGCDISHISCSNFEQHRPYHPSKNGSALQQNFFKTEINEDSETAAVHLLDEELKNSKNSIYGLQDAQKLAQSMYAISLGKSPYLVMVLE